ncbi:MAG: LysM peptidoglycan-binding domain-containing protein [Lachnospiraceae bacterium]
MAFCRTVIHIIQPGDSFYKLAQKYRTTVPDIMMRNPGVNPYNLQVGGKLYICSGVGQNDMQEEELKVNNEMRMAWMQHIYWELLYQSAVIHDLPNRKATENRLLETAEQIAAVFAPFYSENKINRLTELLKKHIEIAGRMLQAMKDGDVRTEETEEALWKDNAAQIARFLADNNTDYDYDELLTYLNRHLDMTKRIMETELSGDYTEVIRLFEEAENQTMELADYLTEGLIRKFI